MPDHVDTSPAAVAQRRLALARRVVGPGYRASTIEMGIAQGLIAAAEREDRLSRALRRLIAATDPYGLEMDSTPWEAHMEFDGALREAKDLLS